MSIIDEVKGLKEEIGLVTSHLKDEEIRRFKKKEFKLPFGIRAKARRAVRQGKMLCVYLRSNKALEFRIVNIISGLIEVDGETYKAYEGNAVYHYKKFPVVVVFEWRLTSGGGIAEEVESRIIGGESSEVLAKELKIADFAQQTIIRVVEKTEFEKDFGKKKRKIPVVLIVILVGVFLYVLSSGLGWL